MRTIRSVSIDIHLAELAMKEDSNFSGFINRLLRAYFTNPEQRTMAQLEAQIAILKAKLQDKKDKYNAQGWVKQ